MNVVFIDTAVDFIRTYADATHHGKEEDILFREMKKKQMSKEHTDQMNDLINDHKISRKMTRELVAAKEKWLKGEQSAFPTILEKLEFITNFYPVHIAKEDKNFFLPIMKYFSKAEQEAMLEEGRVFDRKMIHKKYDKTVTEFEIARKIIPPKRQPNWLDFM